MVGYLGRPHRIRSIWLLLPGSSRRPASSSISTSTRISTSSSNGSAVEVPAGIGINIDDPAVQTTQTDLGPTYGGIDPPCARPCISPLHTHGPDGILHTESAVDQPNTLGQFFTEWGVALTDTCVGGYCSPGTSIQVFVNGEPYEGDAADIQLMDQLEIAIVIGSPPDEVPSSFPEA